MVCKWFVRNPGFSITHDFLYWFESFTLNLSTSFRKLCILGIDKVVNIWKSRGLVHGTNVHWMLNPNHSPDGHEAWNGFPPSSKNTASSLIRSPTALGELQNPQPKNCRLEIKAVRSKLLYRSCILQSHIQVHSFSEEDCSFSFLCKSSSTHVYYVALQ